MQLLLLVIRLLTHNHNCNTRTDTEPAGPMTPPPSVTGCACHKAMIRDYGGACSHCVQGVLRTALHLRCLGLPTCNTARAPSCEKLAHTRLQLAATLHLKNDAIALQELVALNRRHPAEATYHLNIVLFASKIKM
jgi:hypothetical protein